MSCHFCHILYCLLNEISQLFFPPTASQFKTIQLIDLIWMHCAFLLFRFILLKSMQMSGLSKNPLAGLAALGLAGMAPSQTGGLNPTGECEISQL